MATARSRLIELDLLRGFAVAGMILVVTPGDWEMTYPPLRHAAWDGWTLADMVFPAFLFSVGAAIGLPFPRPWREGRERRRFWRRALRRVVALIVVGLLLECTFNLSVAVFGGPIGAPGLGHLRIPGVLQRIALCYLLATWAVVVTGRRDAEGALTIRPSLIAVVVAALLIGYWALMAFTPVPGHGAGRLDPEGNLAAYIDRLVFTPDHLWPLGWASWGGPIVYDPEGLLSTLPAVTDTLFGVLAAWAWRRWPDRAGRTIGAAALAIVAAAPLLDPVIVINKRIWTSSFALLGGGVAGLALAMLIAVSREGRSIPALVPFEILGGNAVLAFIASTLMGRVYDMPIVRTGGEMVAPRAWLNAVMLTVLGEPRLASTGCAVLFVGVVVVLLWPLHRRAIHFRL